MFSRIFFQVPEGFRQAYDETRGDRNFRNLIIMGSMMHLMQALIFSGSLANPFSGNTAIMEAYYSFYIACMFLGMPLFAGMIYLKRRRPEQKKLLRICIMTYTFLIMVYVMGVAVFDQFQNEDVVFYYTMLFVIAIVIDLTVNEHGLLLIPIQAIFCIILLRISHIIGPVNNLINDSNQYFFMAMIVNYYINELQKKNFVQRQMLLESNRELEFLSYYDALSGLYNRRRWEENYNDMYCRARDSQTSMGILIIDIDYFKQYNDNYGHVAGDEVIRQVSAALLQATEGYDVNLGRYGGDEFAISVFDVDELMVRQLIRAIKCTVKALDIDHLHSLNHRQLTLSIGSFTGIPSAKEHPWASIVQADKVLYKEKGNRKIRYSSKK